LRAQGETILTDLSVLQADDLLSQSDGEQGFAASEKKPCNTY